MSTAEGDMADPLLPETMELHDLDPSEFLEEVHSFEFWFQAVEGYLSGRPYGHDPETADRAPEGDERDRLITVLCDYCVGETTALEGASGLIAFAPDRRSKIFLATQVADEARHVEVFLHRLRDLGVENPEEEIARRSSPALRAFKKRLLELVAERDWEASIFAQNVILEALEFAVFQSHAGSADAVTREVLQGIVKDERRHMGFGENELGRRLELVPGKRPRIVEVKQELDHLVLGALEQSLQRVGADAAERQRLGHAYLEAVARLGFA